MSDNSPRSFARFVLASAMTVSFWSPALALETVTFDSPCRMEGLNRPARQTLVVVDQSAVESKSSGDIGDSNRRWINKILSIAGVQDGQSNIISAPRERISVVLAKRDGSDLVRVFSGCSPTYSTNELSELRKASSGVGGQLEKFFGKDVDNRVEGEKKTFRSKLTAALAELPKLDTGKGVTDQSRSFLQAFSILPGAIDVNEGIPRIIVISPMNLGSVKNLTDVKTSRAAGFEMASKMNTDLQRAEIYLTGVAQDPTAYVKDFSQTFFLGSKARLAAVSGETLPNMTEVPARVRIYSGFIDYAGVKVPMQIRLSNDRTGTLVNSWVEVSVKRPVATPLTGKVVCKNEDPDNCVATGDGKEFSQSWAVDVGPEPKFDDSLPFSGVRFFEFSTDKSGLKGRVYDPLVVINGKKDLPFELSLTPNVKF
jgi:hypothetical protein